jgi:hypothetical protein
MEPPWRLPEPPYTKDELRTYLTRGAEQCRATIESLTETKARQRCAFAWGEVTFLELLLYNMRHVQEHTAQLSLFLGQNGLSVPDYVTKAKHSLTDPGAPPESKPPGSGQVCDAGVRAHAQHASRSRGR